MGPRAVGLHRHTRVFLKDHFKWVMCQWPWPIFQSHGHLELSLSNYNHSIVHDISWSIDAPQNLGDGGREGHSLVTITYFSKSQVGNLGFWMITLPSWNIFPPIYTPAWLFFGDLDLLGKVACGILGWELISMNTNLKHYLWSIFYVLWHT